jgi:hypothetical protein
MFQIVRLMLDDHGCVAVSRPLQPLYELREDAAAMAEFDCCRLGDDYGYDDDRDCWWAVDGRGRVHRFEIKQVIDASMAA